MTEPAEAGSASNVGESNWRAGLAVLVLVALLALGGAVADAVAGVGGERRLVARPPTLGSSLVSSSPVAVPAGGVHVVQPGETFWSIAEARGGEADIRVRVDALEEAHGGRTLVAGDRLVLPALD